MSGIETELTSNESCKIVNLVRIVFDGKSDKNEFARTANKICKNHRYNGGHVKRYYWNNRLNEKQEWEIGTDQIYEGIDENGADQNEDMTKPISMIFRDGRIKF